MAKVIFITGASRGFGRIWADAFLERGDKVIVTARNIHTLEDLIVKYEENVLALPLDINDRKACFEAVAKAKQHFGRIDVLINNAGFGLFGAIEETTEEQARAQMETNFFGLLWMTQAIIPLMREQQRGHIIQVSRLMGLVTLPILGVYNASKFAVEGLSETLATEVAAFGIKVTMIEPGGFATDWSGASAVQTEPMEAYAPIKKVLSENPDLANFGEPQATVGAITAVVDTTQPPLRLLLGEVAYPVVTRVYQDRLDLWNEWKELSASAHGLATKQQ